MFRIVFLFAAVLAHASFLSSPALAQTEKVVAMSKGIKLGEKFKGEFTKEHKLWCFWKWQGEAPGISGINFRDDPVCQGAFPITLKAGQDVTITATVTGKERFVGVRILDTEGKRIKEEEFQTLKLQDLPEPRGWTFVNRKTYEVTINELPTTGRYTIIVISDRLGPFTVQATEGSEGDKKEK
jgi:hypothetical protein